MLIPRITLATDGNRHRLSPTPASPGSHPTNPGQNPNALLHYGLEPVGSPPHLSSFVHVSKPEMIRRYSLVAVCLLVVIMCALALWKTSPQWRTKGPAANAAQTASRLPVWLEATAGNQFIARGEGHSIAISPGGLTWNLESRAVNVRFQDARQDAPVVSKTAIQSGRVDDFRGNSRSAWRTNLGRFSKVRYASVYNGIDLAVYGKGTSLEHDFIVQPHADPKQIRLAFDGADSVQLDQSSGAIVAKSGSEELRHLKPVVYQEIDGKRVDVAASYQLAGTQATIHVDNYDESRELVIDPVLRYSTYLGGGNSEQPSALALAPDGTYWIAGSTNSTDFPIVGELPRTSGFGQGDIFVAHIDPRRSGNESVLYAAYVGGSGRETAAGAVVEPSGNVAIIGTTTSVDMPVVGSYDIQLAGGVDVAIIRIDDRRSGTDALVYTTFLGGDGEDYGTAIAVDSRNHLYVTGRTNSENYPVTANPLQSVRQGGFEAFISHVDPDGGSNGLIWSTYYGGSSSDGGTAIAVDERGRIYVGGYTFSGNFPTGNDPLLADYWGAGDGFLIRVDPARPGLEGIDRGTFLGGSGIDYVYGIKLAAEEVVYVTGYTTSDNFPTSGNAPQTRFGGLADAFVARIDHKIPGFGQLTFSTYLGGSRTDIAYSITAETSGRIHVTGYTYSSDFPVSRNALQSRFGGGAQDAFLATLNPALPASESLFYSSFWGGEGLETGYALATDNACTVYLTGQTTDSRMTIQDGYQPGIGGLPDGFVANVNVCQ